MSSRSFTEKRLGDLELEVLLAKGGATAFQAVVFDPNPPGTPTTTIRSNRSANQGAVAPGLAGATQLGSDQIGVVGVTANYGTVGGGDANSVTGQNGTVPGGLQNISAGAHSSAVGQLCTSVGDSSSTEGNSCVAFGRGAHAEGVSTHANGENSHAEGQNNTAGTTEQAFTIVAGGVTVTIPGNVTAQFINGDTLTILPQTPTLKGAVQKTLNVGPTFGGVNTTFDLDSAIDGTTTGGQIVDVNIGQQAHAEGGGNTARANLSHAEGSGTLALGAEAHAEGQATVAGAPQSHTEGQGSTASNVSSHAEGTITVAMGAAAHAEGNLCQASGDSSHAEGFSTLAGNPPKPFTIAAGGVTVTIAGNVTAQFLNGDTLAIQPQSPANAPAVVRTLAVGPTFGFLGTTFDLSGPIDGITTGGIIVDTNFGQEAHSEGQSTTASGPASHAEGTNSIASGSSAHAEGRTAVASGDNSHAEGNNPTASGLDSHSEGLTTTASGVQAHAEGNGSIAGGQISHAQGSSTQAMGDFGAHAEGTSTVAGGGVSHAEGQQCSASGIGGHAEGNFSQAGNKQDAFTIPAGGVTVTIAGEDATPYYHLGDPLAIQPNTPTANVPSNTGLTVASVPVFAAGDTTFDLSAPIDGTTTAGTIIDTAVGMGAHAEGSSTAYGTQSHSQGLGSLAKRNSQSSHASGPNAAFLARGTHQTSALVLRGSTPGNGAGETVELQYFDPLEPFILENGKGYTVTVEMIAGGVIAAARTVRTFLQKYCLRRDGGTTVLAGSGTPESFGDAGAVSWTLVASIGVAPDRVVLTFSTGATTAATQVSARVTFTEVTYP